MKVMALSGIFFIIINILICSCSRVGNFRGIKIGDDIIIVMKKWGVPDLVSKDSVHLQTAEKIPAGDLRIGVPSYGYSKSDSILTEVSNYYYDDGYDHYRFIVVRGRIYKIYHKNEWGSGPWYELNLLDLNK